MPLTDDERQQLKEMEQDIERINAAQQSGALDGTILEMVIALNAKVLAASEWLNRARQELENASEAYDIDKHQYLSLSTTDSQEEYYVAPVTPATQDGFAAFNVLNSNTELQNKYAHLQLETRRIEIMTLSAERDRLNSALDTRNPSSFLSTSNLPQLVQQQEKLERQMLVKLHQYNRDFDALGASDQGAVQLEKEVSRGVLAHLHAEKNELENRLQNLNNLKDAGVDSPDEMTAVIKLELEILSDIRQFNAKVVEVHDILTEIKSENIPLASSRELDAKAAATDILSFAEKNSPEQLEASFFVDVNFHKSQRERFFNHRIEVDSIHTDLNKLYRRYNNAIAQGENAEAEKFYIQMEGKFIDLEQLQKKDAALTAAIAKSPNDELGKLAIDDIESNKEWIAFAAQVRVDHTAMQSKAQNIATAAPSTTVEAATGPSETAMDTASPSTTVGGSAGPETTVWHAARPSTTVGGTAAPSTTAVVAAGSNPEPALVSLARPIPVIASAIPKHMGEQSGKRSSLTETLFSKFSSKPSEEKVLKQCETLAILKKKIDDDEINMKTADPVKRNDAKKKLLTHITMYEKENKELDKMLQALTASGKPLSTETAIKVDAVKSFHHDNIESSQLRNYYQLGQAPSSRGATPTRSDSPVSRDATPTRSESPMSIGSGSDISRPSTPVASRGFK